MSDPELIDNDRIKLLVERTNWIEVGDYYPRAGERIMLFFPGKEIPVVLTTYDDLDNWVPRPTHWARTLTGPAVPG